jgi:hypothetical protein
MMIYVRRAAGRRAFFAALVACLLFAVAAAAAEGTMPAGDLAQGPVTRVLEGGLVVSLEILPRPIEAMKELGFVVILTREGRPVEGAELSLELSMPAMYMGRNSPTLTEVKPGRFEGRGVVPRCMSGDKRWQATILVKEAGASLKVVLPFETS